MFLADDATDATLMLDEQKTGLAFKHLQPLKATFDLGTFLDLEIFDKDIHFLSVLGRLLAQPAMQHAHVGSLIQ